MSKTTLAVSLTIDSIPLCSIWSSWPPLMNDVIKKSLKIYQDLGNRQHPNYVKLGWEIPSQMQSDFTHVCDEEDISKDLIGVILTIFKSGGIWLWWPRSCCLPLKITLPGFSQPLPPSGSGLLPKSQCSFVETPWMWSSHTTSPVEKQGAATTTICRHFWSCKRSVKQEGL